MFTQELQKNLKHNFTVGVGDGAFFGLGLGFASTVTIVPLFVDSLTDATILIGLVASIQTIGWNLPQLLTANFVAKLRRYLPMVMFMTFHERWPFLGLALVALAVPYMSTTLALLLTYLMLAWFAFGGGFTATAWQSMIAKIMPAHRRGTFWGMQSGAASIGIALGGFLAGLLLTAGSYPHNFAVTFFLAFTVMMISMVFLGMTREPVREVEEEVRQRRISLRYYRDIWSRDANLRAFIGARSLSNIAHMCTAFYTIYGVRHFDMSEATAGVMLAVMTLAQTAAAPILGGLGDRWGHRRVFAAGAVSMALSALVAMAAPSTEWLYLAFAFGGFGHSAFWTIGMAMTVDFGTEQERPYYIGLVNTLIAPSAMIAPLIGGLLVDLFSFGVTFGVAAAASFATAAVLLWIVREPRALAGDLQPAVAGRVGD